MRDPNKYKKPPSERGQSPVDNRRTPAEPSQPRKKSLLAWSLGAGTLVLGLTGGVIWYGRGEKPNRHPVVAASGDAVHGQIGQQEINELYVQIREALRPVIEEAKARNERAYVLLGEDHESKKPILLEMLFIRALHELDPKGAGAGIVSEVTQREYREVIAPNDQLPEGGLPGKTLSSIYARNRLGMQVFAADHDESVMEIERLRQEGKEDEAEKLLDDSLKKRNKIIAGCAVDHLKQGGGLITGYLHTGGVMEELNARDKAASMVAFNVSTYDQPSTTGPERSAYYRQSIEFATSDKRVNKIKLPGEVRIPVDAMPSMIERAVEAAPATPKKTWRTGKKDRRGQGLICYGYFLESQRMAHYKPHMEAIHYILTISCLDVRGIVAAVSGFLAVNGGFIIESAQYGDASTARFFQRIEFSLGPDDISGDELKTHFNSAVARHFNMSWQLRDKQRKSRLLIMVSKYGHCLHDLLYRVSTGQLAIEVPAIVSNHNDFADISAWHGVPYYYLPVTKDTRAVQEAEIRRLMEEHNIDLVVLARYMQILSPQLCADLQGRAINIHHSFLPSFKGANPYRQAFDRGVKRIGATAHYVTTELDEGPIIEQDVARVDHTQSPEDLTAIGRDTECLVLARAVKYHTEHRVLLNGTKTVVFK